MDRIVFPNDHPDDYPEWYWKNGLHDACISAVETVELPFDYERFSSNGYKFDRNILKLKIDAENAVYDREIKEIRLFNYKVLTPDITLEGRKKIWWLSDRLVDDGKNFVLKIDLQDFDSTPKEFTVCIKFDRAEVDR